MSHTATKKHAELCMGFMEWSNIRSALQSQLWPRVRRRRVFPWSEKMPFNQCCQMAKFDPFLSLYCARVEGVGAQSK